MKSLWALPLLFSAFIFAVPLHAEEKDAFKIIGVKELSKMLDKTGKDKPFVFDANTEKTRKESGLITSAVPLDTAGQYDTAKYLPSNKKSPLVFYCHSTS